MPDIKRSPPYTTIILSNCPENNHKKCKISYYKGRLKEYCCCSCHSHAKPLPHEEVPKLGIGAIS